MRSGTVTATDRISQVTIVNDVGGTSELPFGTYRVQITRSWGDYEIGARAEGVLLDDTDIAKAREAGTTEWTPEHYAHEYPNNPALAERCREAKTTFNPARVFFAMRDFEVSQ